jgi:hypothetical protein
MLKKALMIGLAVGIGFAALHAVTAEAGWSYLRPPGMWWYYGSVNGCGTITQVRNPEKFPALLRCDIDLTRIETLCKNPNNHDVRPGEAATRVVVSNPIDPEDLLNDKGQKKKGTAELCVGVNELALDPGVLCVNRNWNPIAALTTDFLATCTTERCIGEGDDPCELTAEPEDSLVCECRLPSGSVEYPPDPGTPYTCTELEVEHTPDGPIYTPTERECKLPE